MKRKKMLSTVVPAFLLCLSAHALFAQEAIEFNVWEKQISQLPTNRDVFTKRAPSALPPSVSTDEFKQLFVDYENFFEAEQKPLLWVNKETAFAPQSAINPLKAPFVPFVEKEVLLYGSQIAFHGDVHGDIHSLMAFLSALKEKGILGSNSFRILAPDFYIVFHGDYVDRGNFGSEVLYTVLRLKLANPERVFLVRGNHEDLSLNKRFGFMDELASKYGDDDASTLQSYLKRFYNTLPVALFLGITSQDKTNFLLCVHGGAELGFDHQNFLKQPNETRYASIRFFDRAPNFSLLSPETQQAIHRAGLQNDIVAFSSKSPTSPETIGFMWNDFIVDTPPMNKVVAPSSRGKGIWEYGKRLTEEYLGMGASENVRFLGIIRAHQHSSSPTPMMSRLLKLKDRNSASNPNLGIAKLWTKDLNELGTSVWEGMVTTLLVGPDSHFGMDLNYNFHAFAILETRANWEDWKFYPVRLPIFK